MPVINHSFCLKDGPTAITKPLHPRWITVTRMDAHGLPSGVSLSDLGTEFQVSRYLVMAVFAVGRRHNLLNPMYFSRSPFFIRSRHGFGMVYWQSQMILCYSRTSVYRRQMQYTYSHGMSPRSAKGSHY